MPVASLSCRAALDSGECILPKPVLQCIGAGSLHTCMIQVCSDPTAMATIVVVKHVVFFEGIGRSRRYYLYTAVLVCCIILYYMYTTRYHAVLLKSV